MSFQEKLLSQSYSRNLFWTLTTDLLTSLQWPGKWSIFLLVSIVLLEKLSDYPRNIPEVLEGLIFARHLHDVPLISTEMVDFPSFSHERIMVSYRFPWKIMVSWSFSIHGPRSCATIGISMPRRGGASCWDSWPKLILFIVIYSYYITNMMITIHRCW